MRLLILSLVAITCFAQQPRGGYRIRYSNMRNGEALNGRGMIGAWDLSGVGTGETISPSIGGTSLTVGISTGNDTNDPVSQTGWLDFGTAWLSGADSTALDLSGGKFTMTAVLQATVGNGTLFSKWVGAGSGRSYLFLLGQNAANNKSECAILQGDGVTVADTAPSDLTYTTGVWAAWTCVANGTNIQVFKNGRPSTGTPSTYDGTINNSTSAMQIGALNTAGDYSLSGSIAYAKLSSVALSNAQVWRDYTVLRRRMLKMGITLP